MLDQYGGGGIGVAPAEVEDPSIYYPDSDGEPVAESDYQFYPLTDTVRALRQHLADRPDVYVAGNMLVYYRMNDVTARLAPDVFVVFGVPDHPRRSYFVWREGKAPDFVLEIASASTVDHDLGDKRDRYAAMGVREYWRFDPTGEALDAPLECDVLEGGQYRAVELARDDDGTVWGHSPLLGLDIYAPAGEGRLRLYDPVKGEWLRNLPESEAALAESEAALAESEAALAATEVERDLERQARLSAEAERENESAARAAAETRRESERQARLAAETQSESERQARLAAEAERDAAQERIRRLEERLRGEQNP